MYDWVTHTWSPIIGCSHQCEYCYVKTYADQPVQALLRVNDFPKLGELNTIFVGHLCDMFAEATPHYMVQVVLDHCSRYPKNTYVFQSKNPIRFGEFSFPPNSIFGTTIETNDSALLGSISTAPSPQDRAYGISKIPVTSVTFITIEPILQFHTELFARLIIGTTPDFVNIGADSKKHNLSEPTKTQVLELAKLLTDAGLTIRKKVNLDRLLA